MLSSVRHELGFYIPEDGIFHGFFCVHCPSTCQSVSFALVAHELHYAGDSQRRIEQCQSDSWGTTNSQTWNSMPGIFPHWNGVRVTLSSLNSHYFSPTVGIATGCRLYDRGVGVRVTVGSRIIASSYIQTGSEAQPASYPLSSGDKWAGAWS
jgi:hypothetical protein